MAREADPSLWAIVSALHHRGVVQAAEEDVEDVAVP